MSQAPHPISLIAVVFTNVHVQAIAEHKYTEEATIGHVENNLSVKEAEEEDRVYVAVMRTTVNKAGDPAHPYIIDVECHGAFKVDDTLTKAEAKRGLLITAHSVLHGAIRETVGWLTGRQPHGSITLPLSVLNLKPREHPAPKASEPGSAADED